MVSPRPVTDEQLRRALEVIAYELERRPEHYATLDPIAALEQLRVCADELPSAGSPLRTSYPAVVELAVRAVAALGSLPEPSEVDGLTDFAGFDLWRRQRRPPPR